MTYEDLKTCIKQTPLQQQKEKEFIISDDTTILIKQYLPINDKARLIQDVAIGALDPMTNTFSPVRVNVYYAIGVLKYYCGIEIEEENIIEAYDLFEQHGLLDEIILSIPSEEITYMESLVKDTIDDLARYNSSLAGMLANMSNQANGLDESITNILEKIKNKEGLELLDEIKNVVGND